jgi:hypothetical protein
MQDRVKEYLAKAEWCEEQAENAAELAVSRIYMTLAQCWRDFATGPLARPVPARGQRDDCRSDPTELLNWPNGAGR